MDYEGEQAMELEALEAIFADQLEEFEGNTPEGWSKHGKTWGITIYPSAGVCCLSNCIWLTTSSAPTFMTLLSPPYGPSPDRQRHLLDQAA
jgi:hypothetical protein